MTLFIVLILMVGAVVLMRQHVRIEELENWLNDHDKAFLYDDKGLDFYLHKAEPKKPKAKKKAQP